MLLQQCVFLKTRYFSVWMMALQSESKGVFKRHVYVESEKKNRDYSAKTMFVSKMGREMALNSPSRPLICSYFNEKRTLLHVISICSRIHRV